MYITFRGVKHGTEWISQHLLQSTSMNQVYDIICPNLKYNDRNIRHVVQRCKSEIPKITKYLTITLLLDMSATWSSNCGGIGSLTSVKNRCIRLPNSPDHHSLPTKEVIHLPGISITSSGSHNTSIKLDLSHQIKNISPQASTLTTMP